MQQPVLPRLSQESHQQPLKRKRHTKSSNCLRGLVLHKPHPTCNTITSYQASPTTTGLLERKPTWHGELLLLHPGNPTSNLPLSQWILSCEWSSLLLVAKEHHSQGMNRVGPPAHVTQCSEKSGPRTHNPRPNDKRVLARNS